MYYPCLFCFPLLLLPSSYSVSVFLLPLCNREIKGFFFYVSCTKKINLCKIDPPKASQIPGIAAQSTVSVIETKPMSEAAALKSEIKPTKPVAKPSKQLSSVVRVVSANSVASSAPSSLPSSINANNAPKPLMSKVQIVSSHVETIEESRKSIPKSVVHVEAIDGGSGIIPSRVDIVGGVLPTKSYVNCLIIYFNSLHSFKSWATFSLILL